MAIPLLIPIAPANLAHRPLRPAAHLAPRELRDGLRHGLEMLRLATVPFPAMSTEIITPSSASAASAGTILGPQRRMRRDDPAVPRRRRAPVALVAAPVRRQRRRRVRPHRLPVVEGLGRPGGRGGRAVDQGGRGGAAVVLESVYVRCAIRLSIHKPVNRRRRNLPL